MYFVLVMLSVMLLHSSEIAINGSVEFGTFINASPQKKGIYKYIYIYNFCPHET